MIKLTAGYKKKTPTLKILEGSCCLWELWKLLSILKSEKAMFKSVNGQSEHMTSKCNNLGALSVKNWCEHNILSLKSNSWFAPDHRRQQWGSIAFSNGTVQEKLYFTFSKMYWSLTLDKSLYVLCLLSWNGGKIGLSNRCWLVLLLYLGQISPGVLFKSWPQHHRRAVKVSMVSVLIGKAF